MLITCEEACRRIASDEFAEAGMWQRFVVRFHLVWCRDCWRYRDQITAIAVSVRDLVAGGTSDPSDLSRLQNTICRALEPARPRGSDGHSPDGDTPDDDTPAGDTPPDTP